jgi:signal transduction histidine kinase/DNA-binding response OmpR family regulator
MESQGAAPRRAPGRLGPGQPGIRRSLMAFALLTVVPASVFSVLVSRSLVSSNIAAAAYRAQRLELGNSCERLDRFVAMGQANAVFLAHTPAIKGLVRAHAHGGVDPRDGTTLRTWADSLGALIQALLDTAPRYAVISFTDANGDSVVRAGRDAAGHSVSLPPAPADPSTRQAVAWALNHPDKPFVSHFGLARQPDGRLIDPPRPIVMLGCAVTDDDGCVQGNVLITVDVQDELHQPYERESEGRSAGFHFIVDEAGWYLRHSVQPEREWGGPDERDTGANLRQDLGRACQVALHGGSAEFMRDGERWVVVSKVVGPWPDDPHQLVIGHAFPERELLHNVHWLAISIVLGLLVVIVLTTGIAWFVGQRITRPLVKLAEVVGRFGDGDHAARVTVTSGDEVGRVAEVFNLMAAEVSEQQSRLEARVQERTSDLEVARDRAEAANRAKSAFLASMSHEIRTPLSAILGFAQLAQRDPTATPSVRERLDIIARSGEHLLSLINDLLDMSKIEAGRTTLSAEPFDLHALLGDLEAMFTPRAQGKGLALRMHRDAGVPQHVVADAGKLRQVLINLLGNAVKYTERGHIEVRVTAEAVDDGRIRLSCEVADTGPGIAASELESIFEPFEQSTVGRGAHGGTGLGLTISRQFVRLMGGELTADSRLGEGSVFGFEVLVAPAGEPAVAAALGEVVAMAPGHEAVRLLNVDDEEINRLLVTELLAPLGFELRDAAGGTEAVALWEEWQPRAILLDLAMPDVDGFEVLRRIRAAETDRHTVIIALTASGFNEDRQAVLAAGADDYVRKPFRGPELLSTLGRHLGLTFVYADAEPPPAPPPAEDQPLTAPALAVLPTELREQLRQAAVSGRRERLLALLAEAAARHEALATRLIALVEAYDYAALTSLLEGVDGP